MTNKLSTSISPKMAERSEALRENILNYEFWGEASLRTFSFASLSHFWRNLSGQLIGHMYPQGVKLQVIIKIMSRKNRR